MNDYSTDQAQLQSGWFLRSLAVRPAVMVNGAVPVRVKLHSTFERDAGTLRFGPKGVVMVDGVNMGTWEYSR